MKKYVQLRLAMVTADIGQIELAHKAGIAPSTMSGRMCGHTAFEAPEMYHIGRVLGIPPERYYEYFVADAPGVAQTAKRREA